MMRAGLPRTEGLIETARAGDGRIPFLRQHLARLRGAIHALRMTPPLADIERLLGAAADAAPTHCVVRLELHDGNPEVAIRPLTSVEPPTIIVSDVPHVPYPHKTTAREVFGRAFASARRRGADDALLLSPAGYIAEGTAWNVFWWQSGKLCTPAADLAILPGIGRARIQELMPVAEVRARPEALAGRSMFLVNAVRGVVEIASYQGEAVPGDPRTAELTSAFWPD